MSQLLSDDRVTAEKFVRAGAPFSSIKHLFRNQRTALTFFAKIRGDQSLRFRLAEQCESCAARTDLRMVELQWIAFYTTLSTLHLITLALGHFSNPARSKGVVYRSCHTLCERCAQNLHRRNWLHRASIALGQPSLYVGAVMAIWNLGSLLSARKAPDIHEATLYLSCGLAMVIAGLGLPPVLRSRTVPPALRSAGKTPFVFHHARPMQAVSAATDPAPQGNRFVPKYQESTDKTTWRVKLVVISLIGAALAGLLAMAENVPPALTLGGRVAFVLLLGVTIGFAVSEIKRYRRDRAAYYASARRAFTPDVRSNDH